MPHASRQDVSFLSHGAQCRAWLYAQPKSAAAPLIILAHGLGGTREMRLDAFAERFHDAGYSCLVFDYRHFGASDGAPRQLLDVGSQLKDWHAAIAWARNTGVAARDRIVIWGSSFGGGHVLAVAAADPDIAAVIAQCPFTDGLSSTLALHPVSALKVTALAVLDLIGSWFGRKPIRANLAGRAGDAALMCSHDALSGYRDIQPAAAGAAIPNYVAARFALQIIRYYPGRLAGKIQCPVLACVCNPDTVAPTKTSLRHLRKLKWGTVVQYAYGHFEVYIGKGFEHVVKDQIAFLQSTLPVVPGTARIRMPT